MSKRTDSNIYTIIFAIAMVVLVGSILAFVASSLRGRIAQNGRIETQQNILYAVGVNENEQPYSGSGSVNFIPSENVEEKFSKYIIKQYILQGGEMQEDPEAYLVDLAKEEQAAKNPNYNKRLPLFEAQRDGEKYYIIPMRGQGLWDAIWGYMALDTDMIVKGVYFDHASETPGLGSNIRERFFMDDFHGEHVYDAQGNLQGITVAKGNMDPLNKRKEDHKVDAIAGSTITGDGVTNMIRKYLALYHPYFQQIKSQN
ncbi:MAG: Na(+)-translocating NADH-quinone reductase subunit C [Weeksellaceae bacterium]|nr:Na(+)-translocating NADH-quinone reductase subunit C [Weeksellaceae bacterium]